MNKAIKKISNLDRKYSNIREFIKRNKFILCLFLFSFLIRLVIVLFVKTGIVSDFKTMYDASLELLNGTSNYKHSLYFLTWGYQMGHVLYQTFLLNIVNSVIFLKIINALITSFIPIMIYLISRKMSSERSARIVSIGYSIFLFPLLLNNVLTNQHLPLLLGLVSIYLILNIDFNKKIFGKSLFIGLLLGVANIIRQEGIVYITALIIYSVYLIIRRYNVKKIVISISTIIITYLLVFNLTSFILVKTDISQNGLKNMNSTWKFVTGFNLNTNGMYSNDDAEKYSNYKQVDAAKKELKNRISNYETLPLLFLKKSKITWINSDLSWSIDSVNQNVYQKLNSINQILIIILDILVLFTLFKISRIKDNNTFFIVGLICLIYFGVYLLIEVMPRYAYGFQPFLFILSSLTLDSIGLKLKVKKLNSVVI